MCFSTLLFATSHPSLTPDEFRNYYETKHLPLMRQQPSTDWSNVSTKIHYIAHSEDHGSYLPNVVMGDPTFCDFDMIVEYKFPDQQAFQTFSEAMYADDVRQVREAAEEQFIDRYKTRLVMLAPICDGSCGKSSVQGE